MNIQAGMRQNYDKSASQYDSSYGHDKPDETIPLYVTELNNLLGTAEHKRALDIGTGTGFMLTVLRQAGYEVEGVDFSPEMLAIAQKAFPDVPLKVLEDIEQAADSYPAESFDLIISRQVVHHFVDPIHTFRQWANWLKPEGQIVVIEGIWSRKNWTSNWAQFADQLPLSCTQTPATVAYMMRQAGLDVTAQQLLAQINAYEESKAQGTDEPATLRYIVIGQNPVVKSIQE